MNCKKQNIDIKDITFLYKKGETLENIAKKYKVSSPTIKRYLVLNKVSIRKNRKYNFNENYFEEINTEKKAYFLGYLFADGNIREALNKDRNSPIYNCRLNLHEKDKYILDYFKKDINSNYELRKQLNTNCYYFILCSKKLCKDLINLGCVPNKSLILKFPDKLNKIYYNHFIRGYYDGDGCSFLSKKDNKIIGTIITIMSTFQFCNKLYEILKNNNINCKIEKYNKNKNKKNTYYLKIYARNDQVKFINFIYNKSNIFLIRKFVTNLFILDLFNKKEILKLNKIHSKKVYQYDLELNLINVFNSLKETSIKLYKGRFQNSIGDCCRQYKKTFKNYIWSYTILKKGETNEINN